MVYDWELSTTKTLHRVDLSRIYAHRQSRKPKRCLSTWTELDTLSKAEAV